jgi:ribosomal protein S27AE
MSRDTMPVIRRDWTSEDSNVTVEATIEDDTRFHRGLGTSGRKVERTDKRCPWCGFKHTIRLRHIHPDDRDGVSYWCLNPQCSYFVNDELSWATKPHPEMKPDAPMVWQNTAECPDCGTRHSVVVERHSRLHELADDGTSCIIETPCDACEADQGNPEAEA